MFPIYRKYANERSYFKIESSERFVEIKLTGSLVEEHVFEARIFPDRQLIQDMMDEKDGHWLACSEEEFEAVRP